MTLLKSGDTVGIISPSIVLSDRDSINLDAATAYLRSLGLNPVLAPTALTGLCLTPDSDAQKARDIMDMYRNPEIKALFTAHGGASSLRLLPLLDYETIRCNPKPIFGFSDSTTIQLAVYARTGVPFVTGISLEYEFRGHDIHPTVDSSFKNIINGKPFRAVSGNTMRSGSCEGTLIGECLSCIAQLFGTPYMPDLSGKILLIEDECERPYKLDQMLTQLRFQPGFDKLCGVVFGRFSECEARAHTHGEVSDVINGFVRQTSIPVISDFEFGHFPNRQVLLCGVPYRLNADSCTLEQLI